MASVLVVDDNVDIRSNLFKLIVPHYQCRCAADGELAIDMMTKDPADLVILDEDMPGTDGWETLMVIKDGENGWPETEVIMTTRSSAPEKALKAWCMGVCVYMRKPLSSKLVMHAVDDVLKSRDSKLL